MRLYIAEKLTMLRTTFLLPLTLLTAVFAIAQESPVQWSFHATKTADKTYDVTMLASVQSPWHIYSQTTPEGGPVPTQITFNKNPLLVFDGKAKESGKLITEYEEVFGVDEIYFDGKASFVQTVKLKANVKTNLSGKIKFMVCNDKQCLPPKEVPFSVALQ